MGSELEWAAGMGVVSGGRGVTVVSLRDCTKHFLRTSDGLNVRRAGRRPK